MQHVQLRQLQAQRAFTLVEMLVVIAIIAVLAAALIPALAIAVRRARTTAIAADLRDIIVGIEEYKRVHNDYFPDFTNPDAVEAHVRVAFPRANAPQIRAWFLNNPNLDPAEALVFWLSAIKKNARDPINGQGELEATYTFKSERLGDKDGDGWMEYYPPGVPVPKGQSDNGTPYVYFDGRVVGGIYAYGRTDSSGIFTTMYPEATGAQSSVSFGRVRPYRSDLAINATDGGKTSPSVSPNTTKWMEPGKFQLISAGLDDDFGVDISNNPVTFKTFREPNYSTIGVDYDNLASFSEGQTLGDAAP